MRIDEIRQSVSSLIAGSGDGWTPTPYPVDLLSAEGRPDLHKRFAVVVPETVLEDPRRRLTTQGGTSDGDVGTLARSTLHVVFTWRLRDTAEVSDQDLALQAEHALWAVLSDKPALPYKLVPEGVERAFLPGAEGVYLAIRLRLSVRHMYPLQS